jgi:hypothetical protein
MASLPYTTSSTHGRESRRLRCLASYRHARRSGCSFGSGDPETFRRARPSGSSISVARITFGSTGSRWSGPRFQSGDPETDVVIGRRLAESLWPVQIRRAAIALGA